MKSLQFEDVGRTFTCEPGTSPATPGTMWWWVAVTGESQRYAAFRVEPTDTAATLKPRILAYWAQLLIDRERPRITRPTWAERKSADAQRAGQPAPSPDVSGSPQKTDP